MVNVDAMLRSISAKQFVELYNFDQLEPSDGFRADLYLAQLAAYVFNMAVAAKDRRPLKDFLLKFEQDDVKESELPGEPTSLTQIPEEQERIFRLIFGVEQIKES